MVLKFVRDHAWKFPSMPPLALERGVEGVRRNLRSTSSGQRGQPGPYTPP